VTAALITTPPPDHYQVTVTVANTGNVTASNVSINGAALGGVAVSSYVGGGLPPLWLARGSPRVP
ncbi:MAG: hypothetical protein WBX16_25650, partial [Candidatus Acidiferrales bacterium]